MNKDLNRHKRYVLHPKRHKRLLTAWDLVTTVALVRGQLNLQALMSS